MSNWRTTSRPQQSPLPAKGHRTCPAHKADVIVDTPNFSLADGTNYMASHNTRRNGRWRPFNCGVEETIVVVAGAVAVVVAVVVAVIVSMVATTTETIMTVEAIVVAQQALWRWRYRRSRDTNFGSSRASDSTSGIQNMKCAKTSIVYRPWPGTLRYVLRNFIVVYVISGVQVNRLHFGRCYWSPLSHRL